MATIRLIEPCCAQRHFMQLRNAIGKNGKQDFEGFGDLSLTELLPAILTRYSETEMMIVAPAIPDQAAEIISKWMQRTWARGDGKGRLNCIAKLTIVADMSRKKSPTASRWMKENPYGDRLALVNQKQSDTAILLPDLAITGPVNLSYNEHFIATATTIKEEVDALWEKYIGQTANTEEEKEEERMVEESEAVGDTTEETPVDEQ